MPSNKRNVYLTDNSLSLLAGCDSFSGRLNTIIGRYSRIVADSMPTFTRGEWCAIFDANNGTLYLDDSSITMAWANVADLPGLDEKWGIDSAALVAKMRRLTTAQAIAVVEANERFWANHEKPTDEALKVAGVRIAEEK